MGTKKTTDSTTAAAPKKTRKRKASYYLAILTGESDPVVIVAQTLKAAQAAIVSVKSASSTDLIAAGRHGYRTIDTTLPVQGSTDSASVTDISQAA